jgi:micrococcal nuclease
MYRRLRLLIVLLAVAGAGVLTSCSSRTATAWQPSSAVESGLFTGSPAPPAGATQARVVRVVDGDTIIGQLAGQPTVRVRLIGADTPETVKPGTPVACFGEVASAYTKRMLTGRTVTVAFEPGGRTDRYGRDLWDIWLPDGRLFAGLLVADGLARAYPYPPQTQYAPWLAALQSQAKSGGRGLWGAPCHGKAFSTPDRTWPPS